jgi:hypothetical protein
MCVKGVNYKELPQLRRSGHVSTTLGNFFVSVPFLGQPTIDCAKRQETANRPHCQSRRGRRPWGCSVSPEPVKTVSFRPDPNASVQLVVSPALSRSLPHRALLRCQVMESSRRHDVLEWWRKQRRQLALGFHRGARHRSWSTGMYGLGLGFSLIWDFFVVASIHPIYFSNLLHLHCFRFQKPCCTQTTSAMMIVICVASMTCPCISMCALKGQAPGGAFLNVDVRYGDWIV